MTLLLLAGTGEARKIAEALAGKADVLASLAGATRDPRPLPIPTRVGGFGGAEGFLSELQNRGISRVLDATHPFAARITERTARLCQGAGVPHLLVQRPAWTPRTGDTWTEIATQSDAADHIPAGATVFLATGRQGLEAFSNLDRAEVICRQIEPDASAFPFPGGRFLAGRPPFSTEDEVALFRQLGVDVLVVKNAGGAASATKLDAARELGIPVLMLRRPPIPEGARVVHSVEEAITWALDGS